MGDIYRVIKARQGERRRNTKIRAHLNAERMRETGRRKLE